MVSVAKRMADGGVLAIRGPAIVDQNATQVLDNAHCVHGEGAPLLVEVVEREFGGRGRVHPVQRGLDSKTGLVGVDDISACKLVSKRSEEGIEPRCPFLDHGHDRPGRYRYPIAVRHQFGDPLDRNVLADHQVTHQRSEIRAVAGWTGGLGGKRCTRLISAVTPAVLRSMLDGPHFDWREVEHLAPDLPSDRCVAEIVSASLTVIRCVIDDLVGIGDRGEILAWSTGLLAGLLARPTTTRFRRRFRAAIRRRRLRRVLRVHPEPRPQLCVVRRQGEVRCGQFVQPGSELDELGSEPLILSYQVDVGRLPNGLGGWGVSRNSLRYARRYRRWWTVPQRGVNSYMKSIIEPRFNMTITCQRPSGFRINALSAKLQCEMRGGPPRTAIRSPQPNGIGARGSNHPVKSGSQACRSGLLAPAHDRHQRTIR